MLINISINLRVPCLSPRNAFWVCFGFFFGHVLVMAWTCFRFVLGTLSIFRIDLGCFGNVLGIIWICFGHALDMFATCFEHVLDMF